MSSSVLFLPLVPFDTEAAVHSALVNTAEVFCAKGGVFSLGWLQLQTASAPPGKGWEYQCYS